MGWKAVVFVEGKDDKNFLCCYLGSLGYDVSVSDDQTASEKPEASAKVYVRLIGGVNENRLFDDGKEAKIRQQLDKTDTGLFVLDANNDAQGRREQFEKFKDRISQPETMELFLMPNNEETGALERLLKQIAVKKDAFCCMRAYKKCLQEKGFEGNPDEKGEIFAYCEACGIETDRKKINYADDRQHWNLADKALDRLRAFLMEHLGRA